MTNWKKLKRIGPNTTQTFKYIIPAEIYYLIDYTVLRPHQFMTEFFTSNTRHPEDIKKYFQQQGYNNVKLEYENGYGCWCIEIIDPQIKVTLDQFYDPYNYMGEDTYINNALDKGYTDIEMIKKDYLEYHALIGRKFQKLGLLPKK